MTSGPRRGPGLGADGLLDQVRLPSDSPDEAGWIEVIQKMDEIYADLVHYQVELEEKNAQLEQAQRFISGVLSSMSDVLLVCDAGGRATLVSCRF